MGIVTTLYVKYAIIWRTDDHEGEKGTRERAKRRGETSGKGGRCHPQSNERRDAATLETSRSIMGYGYYDKQYRNRVTIVPNGEAFSRNFKEKSFTVKIRGASRFPHFIPTDP